MLHYFNKTTSFFSKSYRPESPSDSEVSFQPTTFSGLENQGCCKTTLLLHAVCTLCGPFKNIYTALLLMFNMDPRPRTNSRAVFFPGFACPPEFKENTSNESFSLRRAPQGLKKQHNYMRVMRTALCCSLAEQWLSSGPWVASGFWLLASGFFWVVNNYTSCF